MENLNENGRWKRKKANETWNVTEKRKKEEGKWMKICDKEVEKNILTRKTGN